MSRRAWGPASSRRWSADVEASNRDEMSNTRVELKRVTTQYVVEEDRVRLAGEVDGGVVVVLWLTQRLLNRLVAPVCAWLEKLPAVSEVSDATSSARPPIDPAQRLKQSFAQEAARAALVRQPPVAAESAGSEWLVISVDIARGERLLRLTFKGKAGEAINLTLPREPLRQWLSILFQQYQSAQWPIAAFPLWVRTAPQRAPVPPSVLH